MSKIVEKPFRLYRGDIRLAKRRRVSRVPAARQHKFDAGCPCFNDSSGIQKFAYPLLPDKPRGEKHPDNGWFKSVRGRTWTKTTAIHARSPDDRCYSGGEKALAPKCITVFPVFENYLLAWKPQDDAVQQTGHTPQQAGLRTFIDEDMAESGYGIGNSDSPREQGCQSPVEIALDRKVMHQGRPLSAVQPGKPQHNLGFAEYIRTASRKIKANPSEALLPQPTCITAGRRYKNDLPSFFSQRVCQGKPEIEEIPVRICKKEDFSRWLQPGFFDLPVSRSLDGTGGE